MYYGPTPSNPQSNQTDIQHWYFTSYSQPSVMTVFDEIYHSDECIITKDISSSCSNYVVNAFTPGKYMRSMNDEYCTQAAQYHNTDMTFQGRLHPHRYHPALDPCFFVENDC